MPDRSWQRSVWRQLPGLRQVRQRLRPTRPGRLHIRVSSASQAIRVEPASWRRGVSGATLGASPVPRQSGLIQALGLHMTKRMSHLAIFLAVICVSPEAGAVKHDIEDHYMHRDYRIHAGKRSPIYAELVRANLDGSCEFKFMQPHGEPGEDPYFRTTSRVGEGIDGGESDFVGFLLACDAATNSAVVREIDLSKPIGKPR